MESINPVTGELVTDPLAGFLPPDNAQQVGEGYVTYTVESQAALLTGTQIINIASIVFDVNAPIVTPIVTNTIDATPPVSSMTALPAATSLTNLLISWSGSDVGSGVADYTIYVSTNGGPWTPWLQGTTNTSATFPAVGGNSYAFYSAATDEVGNRESSPLIPGAQTTVVSSQPILASSTFSNGLFQFAVEATAGNNYAIQASTKLESWIPIETNIAPFIFVDSNSLKFPWRWYRSIRTP
jgi:hypothetical protein